MPEETTSTTPPQPHVEAQSSPPSGPVAPAPVASPVPARAEQQPAIPEADLAKAKQILDSITGSFSAKVVGQDNLRIALLVALMAGGHVLLESVPGLAKTTAAKTLADSIDASFKRVQCTPDLLPSDIIGTQIFNYSNGKFETQLGPVHANFVLLDEINRSSAKTQSAMLEAMQEKQTSIGGKVHPLPKPFVVLATQNPIEQEGTYELPEAQLDRFLLKEVIAYPTPSEEVEVLRRIESGVLDETNETKPSASLEDIAFLQELVAKVYVDDSIKSYIVSIISATRQPSAIIGNDLGRYVQLGASPRGSITLQQVARALAVINGRSHVIPEDVRQLRYSALRHRIILNFEAVADQVHAEAIIDAIFGAVPTP
ncbi:MAG: MoxR family ATPase [Candidatus Saccharimonadales bacterium]